MKVTLPLALFFAITATVEPGVRGASVPADVASYLTGAAGFSAADLATLEGGHVIARVESGSANTELVALAAVKIRAPRAQVTAYYGQMVSWVDGEVTLGFGRFSNPPSPADVSTLTLDRDDIDALRSCKPGKCDLRIGGKGIEAIRGAIDWNGADAGEQVHRMVRQSIVEYVTAYKARGDEALVTYNDASKPVSLANEWRGILAGSPAFHEYHPALRDYLAQYPKISLPGARDLFYWVKENFGLKPTISAVHGVIYDAPGRADRTTLVQKQIYASHYFDASVAVATLIDGVEGGRPVTYMVYANRSRGDMLKGGFGGVKRAVARDQARKAAKDTLESIRDMLEKTGSGA